MVINIVCTSQYLDICRLYVVGLFLQQIAHNLIAVVRSVLVCIFMHYNYSWRWLLRAVPLAVIVVEVLKVLLDIHNRLQLIFKKKKHKRTIH